MNRTRLIFVAIVVVALIIVGAGLLWTSRSGTPADNGLTVERPEAVKIRILTALPVEPWVRSAAQEFNAGDHTVDGVPIEVEVVAADGLTALGRYDRDEFGALPPDVRPEDLTDADRARLATLSFSSCWWTQRSRVTRSANPGVSPIPGGRIFRATIRSSSF